MDTQQKKKIALWAKITMSALVLAPPIALYLKLCYMSFDGSSLFEMLDRAFIYGAWQTGLWAAAIVALLLIWRPWKKRQHPQ